MNSVARSSRICGKVIVPAALLVVCLVLGRASAGSETGDTAVVKTKFKSTCASCHGQDGAGTALGKSMQTPDLCSPEVQKHSDAELVKIITDGKGNMPSFKNSLSEDQIRSLVQYVRELARKKSASQK